jgi:hypothetical protein
MLRAFAKNRANGNACRLKAAPVTTCASRKNSA